MFLFVFVLLLSMPVFNYNVKAIIDGDWYLCDFAIYPTDTTYFNESVSGTVWLEGIAPFNTNCGVQDLTGNNVYYTNDQSNTINPVFDLKVNTLQLRFNANNTNANSCNTFIYDFKFCDTADNQIFRLNFHDVTDAGIANHIDLFNGNDVLVNNDDTAPKLNNVNITLYPDTDEIEVWIKNTDINNKFVSTNFNYISYLKITNSFIGGGGGCTAMKMYIDNFKINMGLDAPEYLWNIESDYTSGCCVVCEYDTNETLSFASTTDIVVETDYKNYPEGLRINQVALAVDSESDLSTMVSWLRIGDTYQAQRDQYYTYGTDYYIIVWEDINLTWTDEEVPFEFKFIRNAPTDELILLNKHSDLDGDGDIRFKYTMDGSNYNGVYDGDVSLGRDLCYQIWYGYGGLSGDVNISVFNESNLSEDLVGWNITIVNKVSGFIEYSLGNCTNPTVINTTEYGLGQRYFIIENESYYPRTYWANIQSGVNYTLDAYLAPISESWIYCLRVIEDLTDYGQEVPVPDARVTVRKYINTSMGYINISDKFTDYNGNMHVPLIPGEEYHFWISKDGYQSEYTHFIVAANREDCYTFKLGINFTSPFSWDKWFENISLVTEMVGAGYLQLGNITVNYTDHNYSTIDTDTYIYEIFQGTTTYLNYSHNTSNVLNLRFGDINTTRTHLIYFWYNNTASFIDMISPVVIVLDPVYTFRDTRVRSSFDDRVTGIVGPLVINGVNVGWDNALAMGVAFLLLCMLGPFHVGAGLIASGLGTGLTNFVFALWFTDTFPVLLITLAPILIILGIFHIKLSGGIKL